MITVYVADGCPHCRALLADLARRRVPCITVNLSLEPARIEEITSLTWERRLPVVVDHERASVGFEGRSTPWSELGLGQRFRMSV